MISADKMRKLKHINISSDTYIETFQHYLENKNTITEIFLIKVCYPNINLDIFFCSNQSPNRFCEMNNVNININDSNNNNYYEAIKNDYINYFKNNALNNLIPDKNGFITYNNAFIEEKWFKAQIIDFNVDVYRFLNNSLLNNVLISSSYLLPFIICDHYRKLNIKNLVFNYTKILLLKPSLIFYYDFICQETNKLLRRKINEIDIQKFNYKTSIIQRQFRKSISDPIYKLCRSRLDKEFVDLNTSTKYFSTHHLALCWKWEYTSDNN